MEPLTLANDLVAVEVDVSRGADIMTLRHRASGIDVLFSTPWRERADAVRARRAAPSTTDPVAGWLEQYGGGWQLLCPNAGPPRRIAGAPVGFHGEASLVPWQVVGADRTRAALRTELFSTPVVIERELSLQTSTLSIVDTLRNLSPVPLELDYVSHPAFGGTFLQGECTIDTGARHLTLDPGTGSDLADPGSVHDWPWVVGPSGAMTDMRRVPGPVESRMVFGWLSDFSTHWASIRNAGLGLTVRLDWDGTYLPHAWFWQELNASPEFPWFRRARVLAIEPASAETSGPGRRSVLRLEPEQTIEIQISATLTYEEPDSE